MKVLVTGGAGFVGSYVVRELVDGGHEVVVLDLHRPADGASSRVTAVQGGVEDGDLLVGVLERQGVEAVIHLAAFLQFGCARDPKRAIEVNVQGTLNVLEACRRVGVKKLVFASTGGVYGPQSGAIDEDSPILSGVSLYGATKFVGEVLLRHYRDLFGITCVGLRYWGVYGPGEVHSAGVAEVIKRIESTIDGRDVVIEEVGGDDRRQFLFVKDAARATVLALAAGPTRQLAFNIASGKDSYVTFRQFHGVIKSLHPGAGAAAFRGSGQDRGMVDISRAQAELGYLPRFTLEAGIKEDIEFILSRKTA